MYPAFLDDLVDIYHCDNCTVYLLELVGGVGEWAISSVRDVRKLPPSPVRVHNPGRSHPALLGSLVCGQIPPTGQVINQKHMYKALVISVRRTGYLVRLYRHHKRQLCVQSTLHGYTAITL